MAESPIDEALSWHPTSSRDREHIAMTFIEAMLRRAKVLRPDYWARCGRSLGLGNGLVVVVFMCSLLTAAVLVYFLGVLGAFD